MTTMPVLFVGHGSPMNAIEDNSFTHNWQKIAGKIPRPKAILVISAHWFTSGSRIMDAENPTTIYDMYGFPMDLYEIKYNAPGAPALAHEVKKLITSKVEIDNSWGLDHGAWSVLHRMYPKADIPVTQLSIDYNAAPEVHYGIGREITKLRQEGILILASGNVVHNLSLVDFDQKGGFDWAHQFDKYIKTQVLKNDHDAILDYQSAGSSARLSVPTPDHFFPLLYALGASSPNDHIEVFNEEAVYGSLSMTSYLFGH